MDILRILEAVDYVEEVQIKKENTENMKNNDQFQKIHCTVSWNSWKRQILGTIEILVGILRIWIKIL